MTIARAFNFAVFLAFGGAILWLMSACNNATIDVDAGKNAITVLLVAMIGQIAIEMFLSHRRGHHVESAEDAPPGFPVITGKNNEKNGLHSR